MSRSRSVSLEIVIPKNSGPADKMDTYFDNNLHDMDGDRDADADPDPDVEAEESDQTPGRAPSPAFTPCERCLRSGKVCKGASGSRCDHCKRLKQKCSNSTGPARGKPAVNKKPAGFTTTQSFALVKEASPPKLVWQDHQKRKASALNGDPRQNGDAQSLGSGHGDAEELEAKVNKKRRVAKTSFSGPSRAQLQKSITEIEASIRRLQASHTKELERMSGIVKVLSAQVQGMEDD